jgi:hypothetical protein
MTNRRSLWRVLHTQIKAPRRFHIGIFQCTRPTGQANSTDTEARRVQHPGTVHLRETSATRCRCRPELGSGLAEGHPRGLAWTPARTTPPSHSREQVLISREQVLISREQVLISWEHVLITKPPRASHDREAGYRP